MFKLSKNWKIRIFRIAESELLSSGCFLFRQSPLVGTHLILQEVVGLALVVVGQECLCVLIQVVDEALELGGVDVHGDEA